MQKELLYFTAGQFAELHHLNKRTLHYYDEIDLFSPAYKGENGYRYYTYRQSVELENILALRELGMSIEEIKNYLKEPDMDRFLRIAEQKIYDIDNQIRRLKKLKTILREKQNALTFCKGIFDGKIEVACRPKEYLLLTPIQAKDAMAADMAQIMLHLQTAWEYSSYKTGCGSYISLKKAVQGHFEFYDGIFTPIAKANVCDDFFVKPEDEYVCGYCVGDWNKIPRLYRQILDFAALNGLKLTGNCYEKGLNEFAISHMDEYVTQIEIQICSG